MHLTLQKHGKTSTGTLCQAPKSYKVNQQKYFQTVHICRDQTFWSIFAVNVNNWPAFDWNAIGSIISICTHEDKDYDTMILTLLCNINGKNIFF